MVKYFVSLVCLSLLSLCLVAQPPKLSTKSKKAENLFIESISRYRLHNYDEAIGLLNRAIENDKQFVDAYLLLSQVYEDARNDSMAIVASKQAININSEYFPPVYSNLARLEYNAGLYNDALEHLNRYLSYPSEASKKSPETDRLKTNILFAISALKNPVPFDPKNLGSKINTRYNEYWPRLSADEQTLVFTRMLPVDATKDYKYPNIQEDFFESKLYSDQWELAKNLGFPINTPENEGAETISADGKLIIYTRCGGGEKCNLYFSRLVNGSWTAPADMGAPVNSSASEKQPSLSADGKKLFFASNRPGTKGGFDIWCSSLADNGSWSIPVNLGDSINTAFDEYCPFIHHDNQTLYFSSNGWPGLGSYDIFMSKRKNENSWSKPKNLGYPINTNFGEIGLVVNARSNKAYFSSTRAQGSFGGDDIYSFDLYQGARPTPVSYMKGLVYDEDTHQPLQARFELINLTTAQNIMDAKANEDGSFLVCIPSGTDYALNVNYPGYLFYSDNFTLEQKDYVKPFDKDVPLKPIKVGEKVVLRNIFFELEKYELKSESKIELDKLIVLLKNNPNVKIEIGGFTDNSGKADYNMRLSENRAKSVSNYLTSNGISSVRLTSKGYGSDLPIADNSTDEGRAQNRRTEFKVMAK